MAEGPGPCMEFRTVSVCVKTTSVAVGGGGGMMMMGGRRDISWPTILPTGPVTQRNLAEPDSTHAAVGASGSEAWSLISVAAVVPGLPRLGHLPVDSQSAGMAQRARRNGNPLTE